MALPAGVPALLPGSGAIFNTVALVTADAAGILGLATQPQWGLFDQNGQPVIVGDSVISFDNDNESQISNYPVEQGGFESYNKVQLPFEITLVYTKGGSVSDRANFLAAIDAAKASLALLTVLTPEKSYPNVNVKRSTLTRTAKNGVTLLTVNVYCQEIRSAPALQFSNTNTPSSPTPITNAQNPEAASPVNDGTVQPVNPRSQTTTPATNVSPGAIQTPNAALTNSTGSLPPASASSPTGATIVYEGNTGVQSGVVTSATEKGYNLTDGSFVGKNLVNSITPPGYTTVQ